MKIQELLEEALIPEDEQPFELPENWVWVRLGEAIAINPPKPKLDYTDDQLCSFLPMSKVIPKTGRIDSLEEREFQKVKKGYTYFEENDVLFAKITPCMENGNTVIAKGLKNEFGFGSTEFYVCRTSEHIDERYVYYLLRSEKFRKQAKMKMTGAVGQQRVPKKFLENYPLALPPLNEQKRIAEKVESLLSKVDEAEQLIVEVKETFELRRSVILDRAFRGELTKKWRLQNYSTNVKDVISLIQKGLGKKEFPITFDGEVPNGWCLVKLGDISKITMGQSPKGDTYNDIGEGIPLINGPVEFGPTAFSKTKMIKWTTSPTKICEEGDLLVCVRGSTTGRMNIAGFSACIGRGVASIHSPLIQEFLKYKINSIQSDIYSIGTGSTFPSVSSEKLNNIKIGLPPQEEIKEIVLLLDSILNRMEKEKVSLENMEKNIEKIKQSILSKAFRGELGTNDSSEEDAIELLKEVLQEQGK